MVSRIGRSFIGRSLVLVLSLLLMVACSTLPEKKETEQTVAVRRAVEFAKLADESLSFGQWAKAEEEYRNALQMHASIDNLEGMVQVWSSLGFLYLRIGQVIDARRAFNEASIHARILDNKKLILITSLSQAKLLLAEKELEQSLAILDNALQENQKANDEISAILLHNRALVLRELGKEDEAIDNLSKAIELNKRLGVLRELASNHYVLAAMLNKKGQTIAAIAHLNQSLEIDKKIEAPSAIAEDLVALAKVWLRVKPDDPTLGAMQGFLRKPVQIAYDYARRAYRTALAANEVELVLAALQILHDNAVLADAAKEQSQWKALLDSVSKAQGTAAGASSAGQR